jgi:hypothetical protein
MSVGSLNGGVLSLSKLKVGGVDVIPGTVGGVQELVGLEGAITMSSPTATFVATGQNIEMTITYPTPPVESVGGLTGAITFSSPNSSVNITPAGNNIALDIPVRQATYYKTTAQNLSSGSTDITFDATGSWNNVGGYITHTSGSSAFTVVQTGLYQLEFHATVLLNNGTWTTTTNKNVAIDITRPSTAEQSIISSSALMAIQTYAQFVNGSYYLVAGDTINLKITNNFTLTGGTTPPQAQCLQNTIDLNTFFTWTFISV